MAKQSFLLLAALFCTVAVVCGEWSNGNSPPETNFPPQVWTQTGPNDIGLIAPAGAPWGRKLILAGGSDGYEDYKNVWAFNLFRDQAREVDGEVQDVSWVLTPEKLTSLFQNRSGATANVYADYLFVFGGAATCGDKKEPVEVEQLIGGDEHVIHYGGRNEDGTYEDTPSPRVGHSAILYNEELYIFGGYNRTAKRYSGELWKLNVRYGELKWTLITPDDESPIGGRGAHTAILYQDSMYIYGGQNEDGYLGDVWRYDFRTGLYIRHYAWLDRYDYPRPRAGHAAVYQPDESFYVFGGYNSKVGFMNDFWKFDLQQERWVKIFDGTPAGYSESTFDTPSGRAHFAYSVVDSKFVIIGGQVSRGGVDYKFWSPNTRYVPITHPEDFAGDVWAYDFCAHKWEFIGCLTELNINGTIVSPLQCQTNHKPHCKNDCSGNGICVREGHCMCRGEWTREDCSYNVCDLDKYLGYDVELMDRILIVESILKTGKALVALREQLEYIQERLPPFEEFTSCVRFHPKIGELLREQAGIDGLTYDNDLQTSLLPILDEFNQCLEETHDGGRLI